MLLVCNRSQGQEEEVSFSVRSGVGKTNLLLAKESERDTVPVQVLSLLPYHSANQLTDGAISGVQLLGNMGEPGSVESVLIRGGSLPLLNPADLHGVQPIYYLNGIPLIQDHPYAYDVQKYDYNRIGPSTNILSAIDPSNIESIRVIKDPVELAALGPMASHGAIWITTKSSYSGPRKIAIGTYLGFANQQAGETINAEYEDRFRQQFYDKYATDDQLLGYPSYLRDSSSSVYYGPADWSDLYYKNTPVYNVDFSITGGYETANFIFFGSHTKNASAVDNTGLQRFNGSFQINMSPLSWLTTSSMIHFTRMDRNRNRNLRDQFAEVRNVPDMTEPLSPNKAVYSSYLSEFDKSIDDNRNNVVQGFFDVDLDLDKFKFNTRLSFDYNEGLRDYFVPSTLMEGNNFVSNYYGTNTRLNFHNTLAYDLSLNEKSDLRLVAGMDFWKDSYKYNYATAYDGPNDYIKINVVSGNRNDDDYLTPNGFLVYRFTDQEQMNMLSFYFNGEYSYDNLFKLRGLLRHDGSSAFLSNNRWFLSGGLKGSLDINRLIRKEESSSRFQFHASLARNGEVFLTDKFSQGPQYVSDIVGWSEEPTLSSYTGFAAMSRPYNDGWIGYDIERPYSDRLDLSLEGSWWKDRISGQLTYYTQNNKNLLFKMPAPREFGYSYRYSSGMEVMNQGVELDLRANLINRTDFNWRFGVNVSYSANELKALPQGATEIVVGDRKLSVGQAIDHFWLYQNQGIYNSLSEIPQGVVSGQRMTFNGVQLGVGDPIWADTNGDNQINSQDKVLAGNIFPKVRGGLLSTFRYKNVDLAMAFSYSLGGHALNQFASSRMDFVNSELSNSLDNVKEIYFWQRRIEESDYPVYNPWSDVAPYRKDQDLFLQSTDYLKLKSLSLGFDVTKLGRVPSFAKDFERVYIYVAATNLFTVSSFYNNDPELANIYGIYDGYALPVSKTYTLGLKLNL